MFQPIRLIIKVNLCYYLERTPTHPTYSLGHPLVRYPLKITALKFTPLKLANKFQLYANANKPMTNVHAP